MASLTKWLSVRLRTKWLWVQVQSQSLETEKSFFDDQTKDFTINKANFPKNTLVYANEGNLTPVKGDLAIYLDYVVLGQLIPAKNSPQNLEDYECLPSDVKLVVPLSDVNSGKFSGLDKHLTLTMV